MKSKKNSFFKSSEEAISMFLGLVIVVVVVGLVINFFNKRKGVADVPGVQDELVEVEDSTVDTRYVVQAGDSLWNIAEAKYNDGYKWIEIAKINNLTNPGLIEEGQKLVIPQIFSTDIEQETVAVVEDNLEYVVVRNDNLWNIAVNNYGDGFQWVKIWEANQNVLNNPDQLEIGMTLILP
jgi:nucleoid-associated protein YgaU